MDPLAEGTPVFSPYHYCYDNPVNYIDPFGLQGSDPNDDRDIYGRKKHDNNGLYISPMDRQGGMSATGYGDPGCGHWETTMVELGSYVTLENDPQFKFGITPVFVKAITYRQTFVWDTSSWHRNPQRGVCGFLDNVLDYAGKINDAVSAFANTSEKNGLTTIMVRGGKQLVNILELLEL